MSPTLQHGPAQELRLRHFRDRGGACASGESVFSWGHWLERERGVERESEQSVVARKKKKKLDSLCACGAPGAPSSRRARARPWCGSRGARRKSPLSLHSERSEGGDKCESRRGEGRRREEREGQMERKNSSMGSAKRRNTSRSLASGAGAVPQKKKTSTCSSIFFSRRRGAASFVSRFFFYRSRVSLYSFTS